MLLARSGVDVSVVERRDVVGGRTSTMERSGFKFDTGPTFFLYPKVLREIFSAAGRSLDEEIPMYRLDPQYRLVFGSGGELLATPDLERMERAIARLSLDDARGFHRFFCDNRNKFERFTPFLESPFESWRDLAKLDMLMLLPMLRPWRSLDSDLQRYFKDERIRLAFSFQSKYLGMSPFTCPSLFSILSFLEYEHGVFHPAGGCGAVTKTMARIAEELGVRVLLNEPVEEMIFAGRKCTAVRTVNRTLAADAAAFCEESRMDFLDSAEFHRKSGVRWGEGHPPALLHVQGGHAGKNLEGRAWQCKTKTRRASPLWSGRRTACSHSLASICAGISAATFTRCAWHIPAAFQLGPVR
jgi:phytoene desaturase